jgi:hypothetical protein
MAQILKNRSNLVKMLWLSLSPTPQIHRAPARDLPLSRMLIGCCGAVGSVCSRQSTQPRLRILSRDYGASAGFGRLQAPSPNLRVYHRTPNANVLRQLPDRVREPGSTETLAAIFRPTLTFRSSLSHVDLTFSARGLREAMGFPFTGIATVSSSSGNDVTLRPRTIV